MRMTAAKRAALATKLRRDLPATTLRSVYYWTTMQAINFRLLPPQFAVLWTMGASVLWSTYLAVVAHRANET